MGHNFIPIADIKIADNRQRQEFDELKNQHLIESIKSGGLLNAINLRAKDGGWQLVAGERRLRAITEIYELGGSFTYGGFPVPEDTIPFIPLGDLSPLDAEVLELEENIRRVDLTWQEEVAATARITDIRERQAKTAGVQPPSRAELALEIKGEASDHNIREIPRDIILSKNLDNPAVKNAASKKEAYKALLRDDRKVQNLKMAKSVGETLSSASHTLHQGDCFDWMQQQEAGQFDCILTDPPYGMGADEFGDSGKNGGVIGEHFYTDTEETVKAIISKLPFSLYRITKPDAHAYIFCDFDRFHAWKFAMEVAGWKVFRTPLIWVSWSKFRAPWPDSGPQRKYEIILYAKKGKKLCNRLQGDVIEAAPDSNLDHQAQKPVSLFENLLSRSIIPGEKVLDPFCGTGPIFVAAHNLSCFATGCEMDEAAYGIAATRIQNLKGPK